MLVGIYLVVVRWRPRMYEAGDILIMPHGEELRVMYISEKGIITLMNTETKEVMAGSLECLRTPKKVIRRRLDDKPE